MCPGVRNVVPPGAGVLLVVVLVFFVVVLVEVQIERVFAVRVHGVLLPVGRAEVDGVRMVGVVADLDPENLVLHAMAQRLGVTNAAVDGADVNVVGHAKSLAPECIFGAPSGLRTPVPLIKSRRVRGLRGQSDRQVPSQYRLRLSNYLELLGADSQVEWQGNRYAIEGEPRQYNGSGRIRHIDYVMMRR